MSAERATTILGRINVAFLTTAHEISVDEGAGSVIFDNERGGLLLGYRMSLVESLAREIIAGETEFGRRCNLVGIVTNDNDARHAEAWSNGGPWPANLRVPIWNGTGMLAEPSLDELLVRVPATWALLRREDGQSAEEHTKRVTAAKAAYEAALADAFNRMRADLVLSYSYTKIVEHDLLERFGARLLNIHPAILQPGDPQRTPGITPTADLWTRYHEGFLTTHRKKAVDIPDGEPSTYLIPEGHPALGDEAGREVSIVRVPRSARAGVTLHIMEPEVDEGKIVKDAAYELASDELTMQGIRHRNYREMQQLVPDGILTYIAHPGVRQLLLRERQLRQLRQAEAPYAMTG